MESGTAINLDEFEEYLKNKLSKNSVSNYLYHFKKLLKERGVSSYAEIAENIDVLVDEYNTGGKYEYENLKSSRTYHAVLKKFKGFLQEFERKKQVALMEDSSEIRDYSIKEETKICPYCAEIIKKDAIKCRYCGEWFEDAPLVEARQTEKKVDKDGQIEKKASLKDKKSDLYANMKVGEIARKRLMPLLDEKTLPENVLKYLQSKDYSKQYLSIDYPLLQEISSFLEKRHKRYYKLPIKINGKLFRLCNDWYERDRENLIDFIEDFKIQYGD